MAPEAFDVVSLERHVGEKPASKANKQKASQPRDIERRTFLFAARILRMVRELPHDAVGQVITRQLARCGTSVGANVEEAQGAQSRLEFARRLNIALSEAREACYWLRLIGEVGIIPPKRLEAIIQEANELICILTSIVKKSRQRKT